MLGFNACFMQLTVILLQWVVEAKIETQNMMRFALSKRFVIAFALQVIASLVFLFFFAIKENSPESFDTTTFDIGSTIFLCLWGASFAVISWRNLSCHDAYGTRIFLGASVLFDETRMARHVDDNFDRAKFNKEKTEREKRAR